jgi:hypothetical protein
MTSDLIYMATGAVAVLYRQQQAAIERFFKNSLNTFYTHSVLTFWTCYTNTLA